jgi:hypothetical protein
MEAKGETANGPMLVEKRKQFEKTFNIPPDECLISDGWLHSFCKMYVIKPSKAMYGLNIAQV